MLALLGWLIAVAINHIADILPRRESLRQWPKCATCGHQRPRLAWSALLAIFSSLQSCSQCGHRQKTFNRSIIVELVTSGFFVFLLWHYNEGLSLRLGLMVLYTAILILITVTDLEHRLIFNIVILPAILLAAVAAFLTPDLRWKVALLGGATGFILSFLAYLLGRGALGQGDVTLSTFLGLIIGFPHILLSLIFGVFLGGIVSLLLLVTGRVTLKTFIPYGPFLTITGWIMLIWRDEIWLYYFS